MKRIDPGLPGGELVQKGIEDLRQGSETVESLLVSVGAQRLRWSGIDVPESLSDPETRLYLRLAQEHGDDAHSRYNAMIRLLVSFEHALEREFSKTRRDASSASVAETRSSGGSGS